MTSFINRKICMLILHDCENRVSLHLKKKKVKWSRYRLGVTQRVGEWSAARPGRTLPPEKTRYPLHRRLGGPHGWSGRAENLVPTGIRYRTVQPVVSRYTDWATRPTPSLKEIKWIIITLWQWNCTWHSILCLCENLSPIVKGKILTAYVELWFLL